MTQHATDIHAPGQPWPGSETELAQVTCPTCGHAFELAVWRVVNARQSPELARRLREGALFQATCAHCEHLVGLRQHCLYLDPEADACIQLVASDAQARDASRLLEGPAGAATPMGRSRRRVVRDARDLQEKVATFGAGLDDRIIELLKFDLEGQGRLQGVLREGEPGDILFEGCDLSGRLVFALQADANTLELSVPRRDYDLLAAALGSSTLADAQPLAVDQGWAREAVVRLRDEHVLP